jgi:hypothetical protein
MKKKKFKMRNNPEEMKDFEYFGMSGRIILKYILKLEVLECRLYTLQPVHKHPVIIH